MSEVQNIKTAIHEITHATLHNYYAEREKKAPPEQRKDQRTCEVEAESVAYTVCQHYGIDTSDYSFGYIAAWSSDKQTKELKASLATIQETAADLIDSIDEKYQEIVKGKEQEKAVPATKIPGKDSLTADELSHEQNDNRIDGLISSKSFLPDATMNERANAFIALMEQDGQRFGNGERWLIVEYAEQVQDVQKLAAFVKELAEQGFEQKNHYVDPAVVDRVDAEITAAKVQRMIGGPLDPTIQPIVTIVWSESVQLQSGQQMTLAEADPLFQQLDAAHGPGYDKTKFRIDFTFQGELDSYEGRQDFGDGEGGLIDHIKAFHEYYAKDAYWKNHVLRQDGPEALEQDTAHRKMILTEFVPYLRLHCNLTQLEQVGAEQLETLRALPDLDAFDQSRIAYYEALQTYVDNCRRELNTATNGYHLPEMPNFYTTELLAYQEQIREEAWQEAAANDYEPHSSSQPVQEQDEAPAANPIEAPSPVEIAPGTSNDEPAVVSQATAPSYYAIDETAARHAKEAISFFDYRPGSATSEYQQMVDKAVKIAERQKARVDPMYHEKIDRMLDAYCRKLAANMTHHNEIMARVPSVMIAGPSNFPRAEEGKTERCNGQQAVNAYYRKHKTLDGCPYLSPQNIEKLKVDMTQGWNLKDKPFASWALSNNSAEIRRVKARIESLTLKEQLPYVGWEFDGGKVEINREENRLQIFFDKKTNADTRADLKNGGFRWAPKTKTWQRQLADSAFLAADFIQAIQPLTGERPTELQCKVRTEIPFIRKQLESAKDAQTPKKKEKGSER